jgi:chemotaxis protein histidine kinase CheA
MATKSVSAAKPTKSVAAVAAPAAAPAAVVLPVSGPAGGGIRDEEFSGLTEERFISFIRGLTDEGRATVYALLAPAAAAGAGVQTKKRGPGRPKKEAATTAAPLPAVEEGEVPDASEYRVPADEIDTTVCVGRILKGGEDKRWSPIIYREHQCGAAVEEGSDLCAVCARREQKYGETGKVGDWAGRVTEEPLDETHMLGTAWAEKKKPRFVGSGGGGEEVSEAASESGSSDAASAAKPKAKPGRKPMSPEEKAAKAAAKEAEKAAAKAAKEAEKAAAKAEKEAEKAAAKAAKEAEKAAAKPKKAPAAKPKKAAATEAPAAAAAAPAPVEDMEGFLTMVQGNMYWRNGSNLYEFDEATEKPGAYAGQWVDGDEPDIDMDAKEVAADESDTE